MYKAKQQEVENILENRIALYKDRTRIVSKSTNHDNSVMWVEYSTPILNVKISQCTICNRITYAQLYCRHARLNETNEIENYCANCDRETMQLEQYVKANQPKQTFLISER